MEKQYHLEFNCTEHSPKVVNNRTKFQLAVLIYNLEKNHFEWTFIMNKWKKNRMNREMKISYHFVANSQLRSQPERSKLKFLWLCWTEFDMRHVIDWLLVDRRTETIRYCANLHLHEKVSDKMSQNSFKQEDDFRLNWTAPIFFIHEEKPKFDWITFVIIYAMKRVRCIKCALEITYISMAIQWQCFRVILGWTKLKS